jgi:hypothetical protein
MSNYGDGYQDALEEALHKWKTEGAEAALSWLTWITDNDPKEA